MYAPPFLSELASGDTPHFMNKVSDSIRKRMDGCAWQLKVLSIDAEVKAKIVDVKTARKSSACQGESNEISRQIRQIQKKRKECLARALSEVSVEVSSQLKERARILAIEEEAATDASRLKTAETEIGEYNLILGGLGEFVEILKTRKGLDGKRP